MSKKKYYKPYGNSDGFTPKRPDYYVWAVDPKTHHKGSIGAAGPSPTDGSRSS